MTYFSTVKSPKAPSPLVKLPKRSMTTGQTVRNPTIAIRLGVRAVLVFCIARSCSIQEYGAVTRVEVKCDLFAFPNGGRRLDPEDQKGLSNPDLSLIGVSNEDQGFDRSLKDVASLLVVAFEDPDEFW